MGKPNLEQRFETVTNTMPGGGGRPFAYAVDAQHGGILERRWIKSRRCMALVVLADVERRQGDARVYRLQLSGDDALYILARRELCVLLGKRQGTPRKVVLVGFANSFELDFRVFVVGQ